MRVGIISDTHGRLRREVFEVFKEVDYIMHAGDIGSVDVLTELEVLAPILAVYGNVDGFEIRAMCPQVAEIELDYLNFTVTHGDQFGSPTPAVLRKTYPDADVIVYGHTHKPLLQLIDKTVTIMNPGAAGPARFDLKPSIGLMELETGLPPRARLVSLER